MVGRLGMFVCALVFGAGCGSVGIHIAKYRVPAPRAPGRFLAGAAKVEITPPPGYPLGGHSIGGRVARGYWTRLYARAFVFQDSQGHGAALVSCELLAIPAGLHAEVARLLATRHGIPIGPDALILAATHTHHGPAGYMSSAAYNWSGPLPGFDRPLFHFLADRIESAVSEAWQDAQTSAGSRHQVVLRSGYARDVQRNRAIDAFFRNRPEDIRAVLEGSAGAGMNCPDGSSTHCPRYQAVDPTLQVLEVLRGGRRIALLVFFAVHPTAMTHDSPLYGADLTGHAMSVLEHASRLIAGFFNGAEGDVSPRWRLQNRGDAMRLGERLAQSVWEVLRSGATPEEVSEVGSSSKAFQANPRGADTAGFARRPEVGVAALGGAEDGRTILYGYGWHGGVRRGPGAQDAKIAALERHQIGLLRVLKPLLDSPRSYPREFPVSVVWIGESLRLAAIPVEMTTVMGWQLRRKLREEFGQPFVLVGLANEYLGYTVSEREYAAQDYEASATLFGKDEGRVIGELLVKVGRSHEPATNPVAARKFDAGPKFPFHFGPQMLGEPRNVPYEDLEPLMPDAQGRSDDQAPRFEWEEDASADWATDQRRVAILRADGSVVEDDRGPDVLTVLVDGKSKPRKRIWTAVWLAPGNHNDPAQYIIRVQRADGGVPVCSQPFRLGRPVLKVPMPPVPRAESCPSDRSER